MLSPETQPSNRTRAYVAWAVRYGKWIWLIALLVGVLTTWRTVHLYRGLRSELERLLPEQAASVTALQELRERMPGIQILGVVVEAQTAQNLPAAERFIDDLAARVRTYPPEMVAAVRTGIQEERAFIEKHAPLYAELNDLRDIRERIEARRDYEVTKASGNDLLDEDPPPLDFKDLEAKYRKLDPTGGRFENGRFSSAKEHAAVMLVEIGGYSTGMEQRKAVLDRVAADIKALGGPEKYAPGMQYAFTGDPAIAVEEMTALMSDLATSTLVIMAMVIGVLMLYFRWWRAVPAIFLPLLLSTTYSFAVSGLPPFSVKELNSNTAFLGSIIIGNGINFGIILLARYMEERRRGVAAQEAMVKAVHGTRVGTVTAAAAAGIAYGSLMVTQFRGFWQFGVIGGLGMAICWCVTFLLAPSLVLWLDGGRLDNPEVGAPSRWSLTAPLARCISRFPRAIVAAGIAFTLVATIGARSFSSSRFETDFSKMRRRDTWQVGEGFWGRRMDAVLGRYLTPVVILTDTPEQTRKLAEDLRQSLFKPPLDSIVSSVRTIDDVLPTEQQAKIAEVKALREVITPKIRSLIPKERLEEVDRLLGDDSLKPIDPKDLPSSLVTGMRDRKGNLDLAVLVYPKPTKDTWKGEIIQQFARELRTVAARHPGPDGRAPRVAGQAPLSADITASMTRDGTLATVVAIGGVVVLILAAFRWRRETPLVLAALVTGVLWLLFAMVTLDIRLNFANFIGIPITLGIGVDYAVNVMWRYKQDGGRNIIGAVRSTGGAVGMCSITTIIGYSSLLLAENAALYSFGLVAVIGEFTCLATAVVLLPATLLLLDGRQKANDKPSTLAAA